MSGKVVGDIALSDAVFGIEPNSVVMHAAVVNYLANQRQGTQSTLKSEAAAANPGDRKAPATRDRDPSGLLSGDTAALLWARNPVTTDIP